jgi:hypothetical protein
MPSRQRGGTATMIEDILLLTIGVAIFIAMFNVIEMFTR